MGLSESSEASAIVPPPSSLQDLMVYVYLANQVAARHPDKERRHLDYRLFVNTAEPQNHELCKVLVNKLPFSCEPFRELNTESFLQMFTVMAPYLAPHEKAMLSSAKKGGPGAPPPVTLPPPKVMEDSECPICMDTKTEVVLECTHAFCRRCLNQWRQKSPECPLCRHNSKQGLDGWEIVDASTDVPAYFEQQLRSLSTAAVFTPAAGVGTVKR
jgi:hypothetical protein